MYANVSSQRPFVLLDAMDIEATALKRRAQIYERKHPFSPNGNRDDDKSDDDESER